MSTPTQPHRDETTSSSANGHALLRRAKTLSLLSTVALPALLAAIALVLGITTSNVAMIVTAIVVALVAGYAWLRRVRANDRTTRV